MNSSDGDLQELVVDGAGGELDVAGPDRRYSLVVIR